MESKSYSSLRAGAKQFRNVCSFSLMKVSLHVPTSDDEKYRFSNSKKKKKIIRNNGYSTEIQTGRNQSLKVSGNNFRKVAEHH